MSAIYWASLYAPFIKENSLRIVRIDETRLGSLIDWSTQGRFRCERGLEHCGIATGGVQKGQNLRFIEGEYTDYAWVLGGVLFDHGNVSAVLSLCLNALDEQLKNSGRDITLILIAGAIKCLDSLLKWFDDTVPAGGTVENSKRAYAYLEQVIYYREDIKRYEMTRAGLRLLARHAWRFRLALFKNCSDILSWLQIYCTHSNASLRSAALPAYDQFISQISVCLSEDKPLEDPSRTYTAIMKHMPGIVDSRHENPKKVSLAIRAVGKLSGAIIKYSGKDEAFQRLVPFAEMGTHMKN